MAGIRKARKRGDFPCKTRKLESSQVILPTCTRCGQAGVDPNSADLLGDAARRVGRVGATTGAHLTKSQKVETNRLRLELCLSRSIGFQPGRCIETSMRHIMGCCDHEALRSRLSVPFHPDGHGPPRCIDCPNDQTPRVTECFRRAGCVAFRLVLSAYLAKRGGFITQILPKCVGY